jgi:uncharacterized protein with HEPN domain
MKGELTDKVRVAHILDAVAEVEKYLSGVLFESFLTNSEKRFATIKQIEIIGEACNNLSVWIKENHPEVEWKSIKGFRNISIHEYFDISSQLVWQIAQNDLPVLKRQFIEIARELQD